LHKEVEVARLEVLALDKEFQISLLLGRLDLGSSEGQDLPLWEETFWEALNQPNSHHLQHNNKPKHHKLPQKWYKDFHKGHQQVSHKGQPKGHQQGNNEQQCHKQDQHPMEAMEL
jgi:hypothetical protein